MNVINAYTGESMALEVDTSSASSRLMRVLDQIVTECGFPQAIR